MKRKLLLAAVLVASALGLRAQTDVTSTYLTNADFSQTTALTGTYLYGYGKDGSPYGFQAIDGWTSVVTKDAGDSYSGSGTAAGVFSYGSSTQLKGNAKAAPATNPNGEASGNCFGFFGVWGCGGYYYQTVTLAAGKYTITVPMYSQSGTQANTTYTGFFPTSGNNQTVAVNPTVGQWVNQTVTFTLTSDTEGQIRIGYQSTGSGSGANPMLFIDCVKIEYTAQVVKDILSTALTAATKANATLNSSDLASAIATAQDVYDNGDATQEQVNNAAATLNAATELAMSAAGDVTGVFLTNPGFESCTETSTNAAAVGDASPLDISGEWTQSSSAGWSSSAVVAYGGSGQVNGVSAPSADNAGNTGRTLGVSVGWGGTVTYESAAITLPAGVYTLQVYGYNALQGVTQFTSKFGFIPTVGDAKLSSKTSFAYATWEADKVTFTLNEATEGVIQVGGQAISGGSGSNAKVFFDNITIDYKSFLAGAKAEWDEAVAAANQAKTDNPNVTGTELAALNAELAKAEPTTVAGYNEATTALTSKTAAFTAAAPAYNALVAEIAYAQTLNVLTTYAEAALNAEATSSTVVTAAQNLKVLEYTTIKAAYPNDLTSSLLGTWEAGNYGTTSGQGYVGSESYFDKWNGSAMDLSSSKNVTLPKGAYTVMVAGRGVSTTTMNLSVKVGDADAVSVPFLMTGDTGKGIDTAGATNFSDEGTYSNNNIGRGWQYRYVPIVLTADSEVTIAINGHLNSGTWQSFYAPVLLANDATVLGISLTELATAIQAAEDAKDEKSALLTQAAQAADPTAAAIKYETVVGGSEAAALAAAVQAASTVDQTSITAVQAATTALTTATAAYNAAKPAYERAYMVIGIAQKAKELSGVGEETTNLVVGKLQPMFTQASTTAETIGTEANNQITFLMNQAIAYKNIVLGFEKDQYAPYTNAEGLTIIETAKTMGADPANYTNEQFYTQSLAMFNYSWVKNADDVDAIYNGTFAETGTGFNPKGWTRSNNGWGQQITGLTAEANGVNAGTTTAWYYNNNGSWQYGNDGVYTMPLAANQTYVLTFKYRKNGNDWQSWMKASVVNDNNEGLNVAQFSGADNGTTFKTVEAYFTTGAAGNYILSIEQNGNAHLTDVSLVKATSAELAIKEDETFTPASIETYYETVALTRTIKADTWNTFVVPFDISNDELKAAFGDEVAVAEFSEEAEGTNSTVNFNTMATPAITANKPVLLKGNAGTSFNFAGRLIKDNEAKVAGTNFIFAGTYDATTTIPANDYFIASNKLYKSSGATTIKGTRAFLKNIGGGSTIKSMNIFDEEGNATAIDATEIEGQNVNGKVFDLSGREVKTPVRGFYIQNGKKVFIK